MNVPAGQVRIDYNGKETIIGISIDEAFRGRSIGSAMLKKACSNYLNKHSEAVITAYIKFDNAASYAIFKKAGFSNEEIVEEQDFKSYKLYKKLS
jgi:RimJ/RimL family protein N-acetyltransferase